QNEQIFQDSVQLQHQDDLRQEQSLEIPSQTEQQEFQSNNEEVLFQSGTSIIAYLS
ncbi:unnamed protein product, partial [Rotaria sp. Silwood2]